MWKNALLLVGVVSKDGAQFQALIQAYDAALADVVAAAEAGDYVRAARLKLVANDRLFDLITFR